jgi:hypothetical protein
MRAALEALEAMTKGNERDSATQWGRIMLPKNDALNKADAAITSLRSAITQAEQQGDDTARLDWLQSVARCDPKMDGNHVWWPLSFNVCSNIKGPNIRAAIDLARGAGEV